MPTIRIYRADLRHVPAEAAYLLLDRGERKRASAIGHDSSRQEFVRTRALLRMALARSAGGKPEEFDFAAGDNGKPYLRGEPALQFNVSHSGGRALIAVATCPVGIDIERTDERIDHLGLAATVFSAAERKLLLEVPRTGRNEVFFSLWTRKEAYLKATGLGVSGHLKLISSMSPEGIIEDRSQPAVASSSWRVFDLPAPKYFKAALVAPSQNPDILIEDISEILHVDSDRTGAVALEASTPRKSPFKGQICAGTQLYPEWRFP